MRVFTRAELDTIRKNAMKDGIYLCKSNTGYLYIYTYENNTTPFKVVLEIKGKKIMRTARTLDEAIILRTEMLKEYGKKLSKSAGVEVSAIPNVEKYLESATTVKPVLIMGYEGTKL